MQLVEGKFNTAKVFIDSCEQECIEQIRGLLDQQPFHNAKVRIMPDCHAGKSCVIGFTANLGNMIIPNIVGVDIGCLDMNSEVLTENGWIKISEYNQEKILVYDNDQKISRFEYPLAYIKLPCEEFYHFHHSKGLDQMFSDEHRMLIYKGYRSTEYNIETVHTSDFINDVKSCKRLDYYGTNTVFDIENDGLGLSDEIIRILIMISADGRVRYNKDKTKTYVDIHLKKQRKIDRAEALLSKANIKYSCGKGKNGTVFIYFTLDMFYDKSLKMFYKASSDELKVLCDEIYYWDGSIDILRHHYNFTSTNKENADVVQFALATQGIRGGINICTYPKNKNWKDTYIVYQTKNPIVSYNSNENIYKVKSVDGFKYCFTTSTGYFVMRRNNNICITGNCGMLTVELGKVDIDFNKLDDVIRKYIPSGREVNDGRLMRFPKIQEMKCYRDLVDTRKMERAIGSLGGGNHFIEIDVDDDGNKYLVIHTGSRQLGIQTCDIYQKIAIGIHTGKEALWEEEERIKREYKAAGRRSEIHEVIMELHRNFRQTPPDIPTDLCFLKGKYRDDYLHDMKICQEFADENRHMIAKQIIENYGFDVIDEFTTVHNYIDHDSNIIRKGAVSAKKGERILIPINMRDGSLLCIGKGNEDWNYSAPHGAGRICSRTEAFKRFNVSDFEKTMKDAGVFTTCVNHSTLDESPFAYKGMDDIVNNIEPTADIVKIIKPIYNFKANSTTIKKTAKQLEKESDYLQE